MRVATTMRRCPWIIVLSCFAPLTSWAASAPAEPLAVEQSPKAPLVIATDQPPPPPPPPARAVPVYEPPRKTTILGGWSAAVVAPVLTAARAGDTAFTWFGVSLLSYSGQLWFLPPPRRSGFTARAGGRLSLFEAMPLSIYGSDLSGGAGYRFHVDGPHHLALLGAIQGNGGMAMQNDLAVIRFPEAEAAYQWHEEEFFLEVGALAGASLAGRYAVGKKLVVAEEQKSEKDAMQSIHYFKPYLGATASVVIKHAMLTVTARRTYLGDSDPGGPLDHSSGQLCYAVSDKFDKMPWGGCLVGDLYRGELERVAPYEGPVRDAWSYRIGFNVFLAQTLLDKKL